MVLGLVGDESMYPLPLYPHASSLRRATTAVLWEVSELCYFRVENVRIGLIHKWFELLQSPVYSRGKCVVKT